MARLSLLAALSTLSLVACAVDPDVSTEDDDLSGKVASCTAKGNTVVSADSLNVRECAGTACAKLGTAAKGATIELLGELTTAGGLEWARVRVPSLGIESGWVASDYLDCKGKDDAPLGSGQVTFDVQLSDAAKADLAAQKRDVPVRVVIDGVAFDGARIEMHGATSRAYPKKSYDLKFGKCIDPAADPKSCEQGKKPKIEGRLFGDGSTKSIDKVVLNASWIDGTFVRNKVVYDLAREMGALAPRTGTAMLRFNGQAHGFYVAIEPVDKDFFKRRDIDPEGNLYKATQHRSWSPDGDVFLSTDNGPAFKVASGKGSREELQRMFRDVLDRSMDDVGASVLDLNDYRLFHMLQTFSFNKDTFTKNYYLYRLPTGKWRIIFWDCDTTFGQDWEDGRRTNPDEDAWYGGQMGQFAQRFTGERFRDYVGPYLNELRGGKLREDKMNARIDAATSAIRGQASAEAAARGKSFDGEIGWMKEAMARHRRKMEEKLQGECSARNACP